MKKNIIILLLTVIIIAQFSFMLYIKDKTNITSTSIGDENTIKSTNEEVETSENESLNTSLFNSYLMNNPIDNYFEPKLNSKIQAEVRDSLEQYEEVWEKEYNKVIEIVNKKCIYDDDKENLNQFKKSVANLIETATPVLEIEMLDNYNLEPDSPEKHSWGNSTYSYLQGIKGQIYRDASMLIIPYLDDEYEFPDMSEN